FFAGGNFRFVDLAGKLAEMVSVKRGAIAGPFHWSEVGAEAGHGAGAASVQRVDGSAVLTRASHSAAVRREDPAGDPFRAYRLGVCCGNIDQVTACGVAGIVTVDRKTPPVREEARKAVVYMLHAGDVEGSCLSRANGEQRHLQRLAGRNGQHPLAIR